MLVWVWFNWPLQSLGLEKVKTKLLLGERTSLGSTMFYYVLLV